MVERTTFDVPVEEASNDDTAGDGPVTKTGTTTVAIAADDAVVLAADRRASLGGQFTANKRVQKVESVHATAALAMSGSVGGVQSLARTLDAEAELYAARRGEELSMDALATVAGNLVRGVPAQLLLGGVDATGAHVYELDAGGGVVDTDYGAAGSGMQVAYGVLEGRAESVGDAETARALALDAVTAASERDGASGNGAHVATVTADGVDVESRSVADLAGDGAAAATGGASR